MYSFLALIWLKPLKLPNYIQPSVFALSLQLCLHLNPKLLQRATNESVVVGPGNVSPLTLGFAKLTAVEEWSADYEPISSQISPPMPRELKFETNSSGRNVLKNRKISEY
jgi:hypothetical protein